MTIDELLKALNIAEEHLETARQYINSYLDGQYVPKSRFNEVNEEKKTVEGQLVERDKQLKELKKIKGDNEAFQSKIKELEEANKKAAADTAEQMKQLKIDSAIKVALADKAHDADIVANLFDKTKLILGEDGKITGLDEQLKTLQAEKAFLFKSQEPPKQTYEPKGGQNVDASNPFTKENWNMTKQGQLLRDNPEQARAYAAAAGVKI